MYLNSVVAPVLQIGMYILVYLECQQCYSLTHMPTVNSQENVFKKEFWINLRLSSKNIYGYPYIYSVGF